MMRILMMAAIVAMAPTLATAQGQFSQRPVMQPAACQTIALTVNQRASRGFQELNTREACSAFRFLENAYSTLDSGRMQCGRRWAQQLALLESDLLEALDYAGESCSMQ